jgi:pimeloyl-ACP methyl ester carboxylesterase
MECFWTEPSFAKFLHRLSRFSRLILFDKRGCGLSDRVSLDRLPTLEERMDDVRAAMDARGSERAAICGVSEGGAMAALFAARYPQTTAALIMLGSYAKLLRDASYPRGPSEAEREKFLDEIASEWGGRVGSDEPAPSMASI